jgi:hypothetical protein
MQHLLFGDTPLDDDGKTLAECGIGHKSTLTLDPKPAGQKSKKKDASLDSPKEGPTYKVSVGPWQSPMQKGYSPKPKVKREGTRVKKHYNRMGDFYQTTLNTDREANNFKHNVEKEP